MNGFKLFMESFGGYLDKASVKELCSLILSKKDKEHAVNVLADMYAEVGNDLKAEVIRGILSVDKEREVDYLKGDSETHLATVAYHMNALYERSLKLGRAEGVLVFGVGSYVEEFDRNPWIELSFYVDGGDIFVTGVKNRKSLRQSLDVGDASFAVNIFSRVKDSVLDKSRGMQMSVNQYVDMTGDNPMDVGNMRVSITPVGVTKGNWEKKPRGHVNQQYFSDDILNHYLYPRLSWNKDHGGLGTVVAKSVILNGDDPSGAIRDSFIDRCRVEAGRAEVKDLSYHMDLENYDYMKYLAKFYK
jgi:hypothetical protein